MNKHKKGDIVYVDLEGDVGLVKGVVDLAAKSGKLEVTPEGYEKMEIDPTSDDDYNVYSQDEVSVEDDENKEEKKEEKPAAQGKKEKAKAKDKELTKNIDDNLSTDLDSALQKAKSKMGTDKDISAGNEVDEALKTKPDDVGGKPDDEGKPTGEVDIDFNTMTRKEMTTFIKEQELECDYGDLETDEICAWLVDFYTVKEEEKTDDGASRHIADKIQDHVDAINELLKQI